MLFGGGVGDLVDGVGYYLGIGWVLVVGWVGRDDKYVMGGNLS